MSGAPSLVWFRQDLRLADNAALSAAVARGGPVIPCFVLDDEGEGAWRPGGASRSWLHRSLAALAASLEARGSRLILAHGHSQRVIEALVRATGATAVYWNRRYEPDVIARDSALKSGLAAQGIEARSFNSALLFEPHTISNKAGNPFQVFTPYWRHCQSLPIPEPVALPRGRLVSPPAWPDSLALPDLKLAPKLAWDRDFYPFWTPGETGATQRLRDFLAHGIERYDAERDVPSADAVSRLSPHLHFGELGPRQIWAAVRSLSAKSGVFPAHRGAAKFLAEVGWREFAHHLLFHFPKTPSHPLRSEFEAFPWARDPDGRLLRAWQKGRTGYPLIDAGLRQLWSCGWMHNRVRMVVASFLVKHLRLPWTQGAAWFWDTLVDADLASNTLGWQWSAGCGADAAPYFRVFAPVLQGEKFDPKGHYIRRWVPELARLPDELIHQPWEAPAAVLARAGVTLGETYPRPIVDHATARAAALAAFKTLRSGETTTAEEA
ncbi:MAG: deoxyribodipyrimidine photo-lyase [Opitutaceae bacterium]